MSEAATSDRTWAPFLRINGYKASGPCMDATLVVLGPSFWSLTKTISFQLSSHPHFIGLSSLWPAWQGRSFKFWFPSHSTLSVSPSSHVPNHAFSSVITTKKIHRVLTGVFPHLFVRTLFNSSSLKWVVQIYLLYCAISFFPPNQNTLLSPWKNESFFSISKHGDPSDPNNHHLITLTSVTSEGFEIAVSDHLHPFIER